MLAIIIFAILIVGEEVGVEVSTPLRVNSNSGLIGYIAVSTPAATTISTASVLSFGTNEKFVNSAMPNSVVKPGYKTCIFTSPKETERVEGFEATTLNLIERPFVTTEPSWTLSLPPRLFIQFILIGAERPIAGTVITLEVTSTGTVTLTLD